MRQNTAGVILPLDGHDWLSGHMTNSEHMTCVDDVRNGPV